MINLQGVEDFSLGTQQNNRVYHEVNYWKHYMKNGQTNLFIPVPLWK